MQKIYPPTTPFTILVANHNGQVDAKGNRIEIRQGFRQQGINTNVGQSFLGILEGTIAPSTGEVVVANNDFSTGKTKLTLGIYELIADEHYVVAGTTADTAVNLTAAIENLPEFSATVLGSTVSIEGPNGPNGGNEVFKVLYTGTVVNFTMTPTEGTLTVGGPIVAGPQIF